VWQTHFSGNQLPDSWGFEPIFISTHYHDWIALSQTKERLKDTISGNHPTKRDWSLQSGRGKSGPNKNRNDFIGITEIIHP
jgi:hypothetical protein